MTIQDQLNDLNNRLNRMEEKLATNHNSVADAIKPKPIEPDYSHLLPEGYEFCEEQDAEKWVKVEILGLDMEANLGEVKSSTINIIESRIKAYRPIRPIQYHVAIHEVVTAEKDPYQPDWTQAPEGTVAHAFDLSGLGYWYTRNTLVSVWIGNCIASPHTLPSGLDWKQSLRVNPNLK
jgi:hypothetical protein